MSDYGSMLPTQQFLVSRALRRLVCILLRGLFRKNSAVGKDASASASVVERSRKGADFMRA